MTEPTQRYLNDEQLDYVSDLHRNPDKVCACGWYFKDECARHCSNPAKRDALQKEDTNPQ